MATEKERLDFLIKNRCNLNNDIFPLTWYVQSYEGDPLTNNFSDPYDAIDSAIELNFYESITVDRLRHLMQAESYWFHTLWLVCRIVTDKVFKLSTENTIDQWYYILRDYAEKGLLLKQLLEDHPTLNGGLIDYFTPRTVEELFAIVNGFCINTFKKLLENKGYCEKIINADIDIGIIFGYPQIKIDEYSTKMKEVESTLLSLSKKYKEIRKLKGYNLDDLLFEFDNNPEEGNDPKLIEKLISILN